MSVTTQEAAPRPVHRALSHTVPLAAAVVPVGWLLGVAIADSPIPGVRGWAGAPLLASGAAHFALVDTLGRGAGLVAAWVAAVVVASRCALYSAALASRFARQPRWFRWVGPYFLIDQLFVLVVSETTVDDDPTYIRRYYLTIGIAMSACWSLAIGAGIVAGPVIPSAWRMELILVALIVAMLRPTLGTPASRRAATTAVAVGVVVGGMPLGTGLLVATAVGVVAGMRVESTTGAGP